MYAVQLVTKMKSMIEPYLDIRTRAAFEENIDYWIGSHEGSILIGYQYVAQNIRQVYVLIVKLYGYHNIVVGTTRSGKTTSAKTIINLIIQSKINIGIVIFDIEGEFSEFAGYKNVTVYDLEDMAWKARYNIILAELRRANKKRKSRDEKRELFVFDELQHIAPESNESVEGLTREERSMRWTVFREYVEFLRKGLKRNTGSLNCAPTIAGVTKIAFDLCRNKYIHRLESRECEQHLSKVTNTLTKRQQAKLPNLEQGYCVIVGEITNSTRPLFCRMRQFDELKTYSMV